MEGQQISLQWAEEIEKVFIMDRIGGSGLHQRGWIKADELEKAMMQREENQLVVGQFEQCLRVKLSSHLLRQDPGKPRPMVTQPMWVELEKWNQAVWLLRPLAMILCGPWWSGLQGESPRRGQEFVFLLHNTCALKKCCTKHDCVGIYKIMKQ